ncbi:putative cobalt-precorrin-6A synthase [Treponema denticola OTK]|uniref:Cobalt-precorrin-5B C(1)-methyltransferase n=1 Tax=Treponema denticola OTK TaxID=999434 RepID=A0A0F6MSF3_TREDN|nr:cobalt-precorrin-5B (C(1))-methyltransferase CbiD [Treponema denticola]EMB24800.1 putative cobalt-precorrin-6A synthase [Treponema denticola OTK]
MKLDLYIDRDGQKLRCGYTTGSCAAAAAKAAALILGGETMTSVKIDTPAGLVLDLPVEHCRSYKDTDGTAIGEAAVQKDAGDDPDSTDGIYIHARVSYRNDGKVLIDGGEGIGRITKKGLFGEVGEAAINPVPRQMIEKEVLKVSEKGFNVEIFSPQGAEIGKKTFNKNIGVEGGISIIGTKGIVYPMSEDAIKKTIYLEIDGILQNSEKKEILLVPGNYGEGLKEKLNTIIDLPTVKISNYIGDSLSYAYSKGFKTMTLLGHIGKFAKLSIGIFNTHNRTADTRMEAFVYYLAMHGAEKKTIETVNAFLTAEEAFNYLVENKMEMILKAMERGAEERIKKYLKDDSLSIRVLIYSMKYGLVE